MKIHIETSLSINHDV